MKRYTKVNKKNDVGKKDNKPHNKTSSKDKENVVDADFEDVKDDKEKSA